MIRRPRDPGELVRWSAGRHLVIQPMLVALPTLVAVLLAITDWDRDRARAPLPVRGLNTGRSPAGPGRGAAALLPSPCRPAATRSQASPDRDAGICVRRRRTIGCGQAGPVVAFVILAVLVSAESYFEGRLLLAVAGGGHGKSQRAP